MTTFVLVPGAWLGAWAWHDTAEALRGHGHAVLPITLTGLAERADEATAQTDLETHITDITRFVEQNDLREVTLVAHSYAAAPVTGAAGRLGGRVSRVVYVDSAPFAPGMCMLDLMPPQAAEELRRQVTDLGGGWRLPMPPFDILGLTSSLDGLDETLRDLLCGRSVPQPFGTYTQRLAGPVELGPDVDRVVVVCHDFKGLLDAGIPMLGFLNQPPWRRFDLATGHWPMLSTPTELAGILDSAAS